MFRIIVSALLVALVQGKLAENNATIFTLCSYTSSSQEKCEALLDAADQKGIDLALDCNRQDNLTECLRCVKFYNNHIIVLDQYDYRKARKSGLRPVLFARERIDQFYIAVAPKNISLIEYNELPIQVNESDLNALHSAVAFNVLRGRDSCSELSPSTINGKSIHILNSIDYEPEINDILLCPSAKYAKTEQIETCNVNAGLQNAVFIAKPAKDKQIKQLAKIFSNILVNFHGGKFNFFDTFDGADNVILKNTTIGFDFWPTYLNGVDERTFNKLHCNHNDTIPSFNRIKIKCKHDCNITVHP